MAKYIQFAVIPLLLGFVFFAIAQEWEKPVIKVVSVEFHPKNFRDKSGQVNVSRNVSSLLDKENVLQLKNHMKNIYIECECTRPIRWSFEGVTAPARLNLTAIRKFSKGKELFIAEFKIVRVTSQLTGKWSCQLVENKAIETSISIFGEDYGYRGEDPYFVEYGKTVTIYAKRGEEVTFPCVLWRRNIKASLAFKVNSESGMVYEDLDPSGVLFRPSVGFKMNITTNTDVVPWGNYICYSSLNKTYDTVKVRLIERFDVTVSPAKESLELFFNDTMKLNCTTNDSTLRLEISSPIDPRIQFSRTGSGVYLTYGNLTFSDDGVITCTAFNKNGTPVFEHSWSYSVISDVDKKRRGWVYFFSRRTLKPNWACWAKSSNVPTVGFVRCTSPMECEVRKSCFKLANRCDEIEARICAGGCVAIVILNSPGILSCTGDGIEDRQLQLYIGASNKTHNNTKVLEKDILKAKSTFGNETYENSIIKLSCTGSSFYFARGFYWSVFTLNDSKNEISHINRLDNETRELFNVAEVIHSKEDFLSTGLIVLKSTIKLLTKNITEIVCNAPHWDSFKKSVYSLSFKVKETTAPSVVQNEIEDDVTVRDKNHTIRCEAKGIPTPSISWLKDEKQLPKSVEIRGDGDTLGFDEIAFAHQGVYICTATNPGGSVQQRIKLNVEDPQQRVILGISISGIIAMLILFVLLIFFWRRIQRQKKMLRNLTDAEIEEFLYGNPDALDTLGETNRQGHLLAYNKDYEFPKDSLDIQMEEKLGSGAYGLVIRGIARGLFPGEEETVVAIKTLQPNADITYFKALLIELKIMSVIGRNPYLVNLLGACTTDIRKREVFIIVEYCANGSLEKFLKAHRGDFITFQSNVRYSMEPKRATVLYENQCDNRPPKITYDNLLLWCYQVAKGMEYLSSKKVIHGDLAARNVLLTNRLFAKVGDFGLSRQLYEYANYVKKQQGPLPWRWMAIESLCDMEFSYATDVWAYGIVVWEIFSLGEIPYPGLNWTEDFMKKLRQGNRPPKPDLAVPSLYNVMVQCWHYGPGDRPSFPELANIFMNYLQEARIHVEEPIPPPMRKRFDLQINNEAYRVDTQTP